MPGFPPKLKTRIKDTVKYLAPPVLISIGKELKRKLRNQPQPWTYFPQGWNTLQKDPAIKGWNVASIIEAYKARWPSMEKILKSPLPLVTAPEHFSKLQMANSPYDQLDIILHNVVMSFAYAFAVSTRLKSSISMLDWGGAAGQYYLISQALVPDLNIDYYCKDVPVMVEFGRTILPEAHFIDDDTWTERKFDFVFASGAFHYQEHWNLLLKQLAGSTEGHLFITQLPIVHNVNSFVMVQRPYAHGYNTEYLGWCLDRKEFLDKAKESGLELVREFILGYKPPIHNAPEQAEYRGFLFKPSTRN